MAALRWPLFLALLADAQVLMLLDGHTVAVPVLGIKLREADALRVGTPNSVFAEGVWVHND